MESITKRHYWLVVAIFSGLGWLLYANTLDVPFYFDDTRNIVENLPLRVTSPTPQALLDAAFNKVQPNRPVANLSFALNYYWHQYNLAGYHIFNITCHILTGFFLFLLFQATLQTPALQNRYPHPAKLALAAALLWFVNPVHSQAVTYTVQRMTGMAAMFYVLALWLYVRGRLATPGHRQWPWHAAAGLAGLLALGCKEIAATLPVMTVLLEWYFIQDLDRRWLKRSAPILLAVTGFAALLAWHSLGASPLESITKTYAYRDFTPWERVLTEWRVVMHYLSLLAYPNPSRLNLDYDFALSRSILNPATTLLAGLAILLLFATATVSTKKFRLFSFAILWFLGNLVIESSVIGLEIIFEHRAYLPSMFLALALVAACSRPGRLRWAGIIALCGAIALGSFWTRARNQLWRDPVALWSDCAKKSPNKARVHNNLSVALMESGQLDHALREAKNALRLQPDFVNAHVNLGNIYRDQQHWDAALAEYFAALQLKPDYAEVYTSIGNVCVAKGQLDRAATFYQKTLALQPDSVRARVNLASLLAGRGQTELAIAEFEKAVAMQPEDGDIRYNLGLAYIAAHRYPEALHALEAALRINPADQQARLAAEKLRHPRNAH